ncbi:f78dce73-660f-4a9f-a727-5d59d8977474 [Thermothielavioides terrestris]|uniref:F78dce73-660f-4a9f-a727-5d59d8977474 n=1 Tax=Thermothielavioides terrestris TaxID=2587410 RepID=A0A3S4EX06_9PEZI|nr:f78dce73-660f-4a9f-a727-5d59d8977474 [Thermothielavioides terrestris]
MDHGSLQEEPVSRSGPLLDHLDLDHRRGRRAYEPTPHPPPQQNEYEYLDHSDDLGVPASPFAAANLAAFSANSLAAAPSPDSHNESGDPADFYRSYQGSPQTGDVSPPVKDPMASAVSSSARPAPSAPSNSQSFASRIARPRTANSANASASKSTPQLAPGDSRLAPPRHTGLLFGEILPEQSDSVTPGFGIESAHEENQQCLEPWQSRIYALKLALHLQVLHCQRENIPTTCLIGVGRTDADE